ncbi:YkyB family protein [Bacillus sp. T33-2]|uniref:YkyB family protein n=1 Tax=Bacillus sp. T33-2 TaxID=2054168 RepID=UPI000C77BE6A|nr:YkyB family protein [Bacillus sp. T33-2]PLR97475.1 hypothetical protein CVD19_08270 [Bacillus sp. T33-2]
MNSDRKNSPLPSPTIDNLSQAIFTVNRHAKTATNPKYLYQLKHEALQKLLKEGKAKKVGLHFSNNPQFSQQQSDVLVKCGEYTFHIPPTKADFEVLPHLGRLDDATRNPKAKVTLANAKKLLISYTGLREDTNSPGHKKRPYQKPEFKKLGERYN